MAKRCDIRMAVSLKKLEHQVLKQCYPFTKLYGLQKKSCFSRVVCIMILTVNVRPELSKLEAAGIFSTKIKIEFISPQSHI
jgi:hypothetical protein